MKVALAHDSMTQFGGAERVLQALHELYPDAPVFTLVYDKKVAEHFEGWKIVSSPLQYLYNVLPRFQLLLPLIPFALRFFNFSEYDLVITSSSAFIKAIHAPKKTLHVNYCHTPTRFLWMESQQYIRDEVPFILRPLVRLYLKWLRRWDYKAAQRVDYFIANSKNVQQRIKKFYNRESILIYPFVDGAQFYPSAPKEDFYVVAGRLHAHKHIDLIVDAFNRNSKQLHVIGTGRAKPMLEKMAKPNVQFLGKVSDELLRNELSSAKGFIYPQEEDFGLLPIEANACGTAVIAYGHGGALETITAGRTGVFFEHRNVEGVERALRKFEGYNFKTEDLFENAARFSKERFKQRIAEFVAAHTQDKI